MASATDAGIVTIESRAQDNWPGADSTIAWLGVPFTPPDGKWLRVTPRFGETIQDTHGGDNRLTGLLFLDLFDQPGSGLGSLRDDADTMRDAFDRVTDGTVVFGAASGPNPINDPNGWVGLQLTVPFTIEETT